MHALSGRPPRFRPTPVLALLVGAGALCWGQESPQASAGTPAPRRLEAAEIDRLVDGFERFNVPCRYTVDYTRFFLVEGDAALSENDAWERVQSVLVAGADGGVSRARADFEEAFRTTVENLRARGAGAPGSGLTGYRSRVVSTPEVQIEESITEITYGTVGLLRCREFQILHGYSDFAGNQIEVQPFASVPPIPSLDELLTPLRIDPSSLGWFRRYLWDELPLPAEEGVRALQFYPEVRPEDRYQVELDADTGLPLAISHRTSEAGERVPLLGLFEHAPVAPGSSQLWLSSVLTLTLYDGNDAEIKVHPHGEGAVFGGAELTKLAFSLGHLWLPPAPHPLEEPRSHFACPGRPRGCL